MVDQAQPRHERRDRQHLQRVPPHDTATEMALLGAALQPHARDVPPIVAALGPDAYYSTSEKPLSNTLIADAICRLVAAGMPVDTGTVGNLLRDDGQLDQVAGTVQGVAKQGDAYLLAIMVEAYYSDATRAQIDADLLAGLARKRRILSLAHQVVEGVYARTEIAGLAAQLQTTIEAEAASLTSSWEPVNLAAILAGEGVEARPSILCRTDGQALLYPNQIHAFNAEPEAGKGWLALWACLEVIEHGGHALYVDFEDRPLTAVERLLALGASPEQILERFHYVGPAEPVDVGATARIRGVLSAWPIAVCIIDSVGEAMALSGLDEKDGTEFRQFVAALPAVAMRAGAAVVLIDHLVKDPEKRGGYAIGSQAKKAALDVTLEVQVVAPFGRDRDGSAKIWVRKDRHGHLRGAAFEGRLMAEMHMASRDGGSSVSIELRPPGSTPGRQFRPTTIMADVSRTVQQAAGPMTKTTLRSCIRGKNAYKDIAIGLLVAEGYISQTTKGYSHVRPFTNTPEDGPNQGQLTDQDDFRDDF